MKKVCLLFLTVFILFLGMNVVSANERYSETMVENEGTISYLATNKECNAMFGDPDDSEYLAYYLQIILDVIKYIGIILCILLTIVDFAKALLGDDKEMYKPLAKTAFNRLCYAVMLFFLPAVVETLLSLIGAYGTCGIS